MNDHELLLIELEPEIMVAKLLVSLCVSIVIQRDVYVVIAGVQEGEKWHSSSRIDLDYPLC